MPAASAGAVASSQACATSANKLLPTGLFSSTPNSPFST
jgi:hypothetical protein